MGAVRLVASGPAVAGPHPADGSRWPGQLPRELGVAGLRMRYGMTDVLHDVTFQVRQGEVLALLGPNGAGKTTTIEILEGFRMRSAGRAAVLGTDPARGDERWRARMGIVLQSWHDHGKRRAGRPLADPMPHPAPQPPQP